MEMKDSPEKKGFLKSYFRLSVKLPEHQFYGKESDFVKLVNDTMVS